MKKKILNITKKLIIVVTTAIFIMLIKEISLPDTIIEKDEISEVSSSDNITENYIAEEELLSSDYDSEETTNISSSTRTVEKPRNLTQAEYDNLGFSFKTMTNNVNVYVNGSTTSGTSFKFLYLAPYYYMVTYSSWMTGDTTYYLEKLDAARVETATGYPRNIRISIPESRTDVFYYNGTYYFNVYNGFNTVGKVCYITVNASGKATGLSLLSEVPYKEYTISPYSNNTTMGTVSGGGTVQEGLTTTITATAKTGYRFVGWYTNSACTGTAVSTSASYTVTSSYNASYYAKFEQITYTISAYSNNTTMGSVAGGNTYNYGASVNLTATAKTGYRFIGWYTNSACTGTAVSTSASYTFNAYSSATYYAKFQMNVYTIKSVVAGQATTNVSYNYTDQITMSKPTRVGYTFTGWKITGVDSNASYYTGSAWAKFTSGSILNATYFRYLNSTNNQTVTFEAQWKVNSYKYQTIIDGITTNYDSNYDSVITINTPTKTGYTFTGWTVADSNASTAQYSTNNSSYYYISGVTPSNAKYFRNLTPTNGGVVKLTANFKANTYTYQTIIDGVVKSNSATYANSFNLPNPSKVGYIFTGWTVSGYSSTAQYSTNNTNFYNCSSSVPKTATYFKNMTSTANGTVKFTANFTPITYKYVVDGVEKTATYDTPFILSNPTKTGFTFTGYTVTNISSNNAVQSSNGTTYTAISNNTTTKYIYFKNLAEASTGKVEFTSNFTRNNYVFSVLSSNTRFGNTTISYDTTTYTSVTVPYESKYTIKAFANTGYKFVGWYTNSSFSGQPISTNETEEVTAQALSITYYAKFEQSGIHVSASYIDNSTLNQFNSLKAAIEQAVKTNENNIYIDGPIGSLYGNYNQFVNNISAYIPYTSTMDIKIVGIGSNNTIYNNAANAMIDVRAGSITFENVTINGTGSNNTAGNRDNALLRVSGGTIVLGNGTIVTNSYNIGSGIHRSNDWCPGVIDVYRGTLVMEEGSLLTANTTTYGGDIFVHGGQFIMNGGSILGSNESSIYALTDGNISTIEINNSSIVSSIYIDKDSSLSVSNLNNDISLYKNNSMKNGDIVGTTDTISAAYITGINPESNGKTILVGTNLNGSLVWKEESLPKSKLELAIEKASNDKSFTIIEDETVNLASVLGKYVYHLSGCLSIGSVSSTDSSVLVSGSGKRAIITGLEAGIATITLKNISTYRCYYYGTTSISEMTINITILPKIGNIVPSSNAIAITNCDKDTNYSIKDENGITLSTAIPAEDTKTGEYYIRFENLTKLSSYTIEATKNGQVSIANVLTPDLSALEYAIMNASGYYMNRGESVYLTSILGKSVYHLSHCINISDVTILSGSTNASLSGTGKQTVVTAQKAGYIDLSMKVKTNGWCAVYGTVSEWTASVTVRIYILPSLTDNEVSITSSSINLPTIEGYTYTIDGNPIESNIIEGLAPNKLYTIDINYTFMEGELEKTLTGSYTFRTKEDTTNSSTLYDGIINRAEDLRELAQESALSDKTINQINKLIDKTISKLSPESELTEFTTANKIFDTLEKIIKDSSNLPIGDKSGDETTSIIEEFLNEINSNLENEETDLNRVLEELEKTNGTSEDESFITDIFEYKDEINNLPQYPSLEDYFDIINKFDELTPSEQKYLEEDFNDLLDKIKAICINNINSLSLSTDRLIYTDNIEDIYAGISTNIEKAYSMIFEYQKALAHNEVKEYYNITPVSDTYKQLINDLSTITIEYNSSNHVTDYRASLDLISSKKEELFDNIYKETIIDSLKIIENPSLPSEYQIDLITKTSDGFIYQGVVYNEYKDAYYAALLNDQKLVLIDKLTSETNDKKAEFDSKYQSELTGETYLSLIEDLNEIKLSDIDDINLSLNYEEASNIITITLPIQLALLDAKDEAYTKISADVNSFLDDLALNTKLDNYKNSDGLSLDIKKIIKDSIESFEESIESSISSDSNKTAVSAHVNEITNRIEELKSIIKQIEDSIESFNTVNSNDKYNEELKNDIHLELDGLIPGILDEEKTTTEIYNDVKDFNNSIQDVDKKQDAIDKVEELFNTAIEALSPSQKEELEAKKEEIVNEIIAVKPDSTSSVEDKLNEIIESTTDLLDLTEEKNKANTDIKNYGNAVINSTPTSSNADKKKITNDINDIINTSKISINAASTSEDIQNIKKDAYNKINQVIKDYDKLVQDRADAIAAIDTKVTSTGITNQDLIDKIKENINNSASSTNVAEVKELGINQIDALVSIETIYQAIDKTSYQEKLKTSLEKELNEAINIVINSNKGTSFEAIEKEFTDSIAIIEAINTSFNKFVTDVSVNTNVKDEYIAEGKIILAEVIEYINNHDASLNTNKLEELKCQLTNLVSVSTLEENYVVEINKLTDLLDSEKDEFNSKANVYIKSVITKIEDNTVSNTDLTNLEDKLNEIITKATALNDSKTEDPLKDDKESVITELTELKGIIEELGITITDFDSITDGIQSFEDQIGKINTATTIADVNNLKDSIDTILINSLKDELKAQYDIAVELKVNGFVVDTKVDSLTVLIGEDPDGKALTVAEMKAQLEAINGVIEIYNKLNTNGSPYNITIADYLSSAINSTSNSIQVRIDELVQKGLDLVIDGVTDLSVIKKELEHCENLDSVYQDSTISNKDNIEKILEITDADTKSIDNLYNRIVEDFGYAVESVDAVTGEKTYKDYMTSVPNYEDFLPTDNTGIYELYTNHEGITTPIKSIILSYEFSTDTTLNNLILSNISDKVMSATTIEELDQIYENAKKTDSELINAYNDALAQLNNLPQNDSTYKTLIYDNSLELQAIKDNFMNSYVDGTTLTNDDRIYIQNALNSFIGFTELASKLAIEQKSYTDSVEYMKEALDGLSSLGFENSSKDVFDNAILTNNKANIDSAIESNKTYLETILKEQLKTIASDVLIGTNLTNMNERIESVIPTSDDVLTDTNLIIKEIFEAYKTQILDNSQSMTDDAKDTLNSYESEYVYGTLDTTALDTLYSDFVTVINNVTDETISGINSLKGLDNFNTLLNPEILNVEKEYASSSASTYNELNGTDVQFITTDLETHTDIVNAYHDFVANVASKVELNKKIDSAKKEVEQAYNNYVSDGYNFTQSVNLDNKLQEFDAATTEEDVNTTKVNIINEWELAKAKEDYLNNLDDYKESYPSITEDKWSSIIQEVNNSTKAEDITNIINNLPTVDKKEEAKKEINEIITEIANAGGTISEDKKNELINKVENLTDINDLDSTMADIKTELDGTIIATPDELINNIIDEILGETDFSSKVIEDIKGNLHPTFDSNPTYDEFVVVKENIVNQLNEIISKEEAKEIIESLDKLTKAEKEELTNKIDQLTNPELETKIDEVIKEAVTKNDNKDGSLTDLEFNTIIDSYKSDLDLIIGNIVSTELSDELITNINNEITELYEKISTQTNTISVLDLEILFNDVFKEISNIVDDVNKANTKAESIKDIITEAKVSHPALDFDVIYSDTNNPFKDAQVDTIEKVNATYNKIITDIESLIEKETIESIEKQEANNTLTKVALEEMEKINSYDIPQVAKDYYIDLVNKALEDAIKALDTSSNISETVTTETTNIKKYTEENVGDAFKYNEVYQEFSVLISTDVDTYYTANYGTYTKIDKDTYINEIESIFKE